MNTKRSANLLPIGLSVYVRSGDNTRTLRGVIDSYADFPFATIRVTDSYSQYGLANVVIGQLYCFPIYWLEPISALQLLAESTD